MKYCSQCGAETRIAIPPGEVLPRHMCEACHTIHYQNPKIVAGCIPEWRDQILICRRAIEPRTGYWTFPAGFMEMDESVEQAAAREALEEAKVEVDVTALFAVFTLTRVNQVYVVFRGSMRNQDFGIGDESSETRLVDPERLPWDELAFPVIRETLERYVQDRKQGTFSVHYGVVTRGFK